MFFKGVTDHDVDSRTTYHFPLVKENPVVSMATPRNAWCGWDLGDPDPSKPSALPRTLSRARNMTVATVIDRTGEAYKNNRRTTVEYPCDDYATCRLSAHPPEAQFRELSEFGYRLSCKSLSARELATRTNADSKSVNVTNSDCVGRAVCCTSTPAERKLGAQKIDRESAIELAKAQATCATSKAAPCTFHSQMHEDAAMYNTYFSKTRGGFFLEIGAFDGSTWSNSLFFEETLGWSGVLIEASPVTFAKLQRNRGSAKNILYNRAVCPHETNITFYGDDEMASINGALKSHPDQQSNDQRALHTVKCERMGTLLQRAGVRQIDFWSLDVEGSELGVLQSMNWSIPVHVMVIERTMGPNEAEIFHFMLDHGFTYSREQRGNRVWVNHNYPNPPEPVASALPAI